MTAQTHSFQAEVAQLLHLVTHSLYSNPDIFMREHSRLSTPRQNVSRARGRPPVSGKRQKKSLGVQDGQCPL